MADDFIPMTKAARKRHIQEAGTDCCPYCKVKQPEMNFEYGDLDPVECGDIEQKCTCLKCGRRWIDVFRMVEVHEIFGSGTGW